MKSSDISTSKFIVYNNSHGHYGDRFVASFSNYQEAKNYGEWFVACEREKAIETNHQFGEVVYPPDLVSVNIVCIQ